MVNRARASSSYPNHFQGKTAITHDVECYQNTNNWKAARSFLKPALRRRRFYWFHLKWKLFYRRKFLFHFPPQFQSSAIFHFINIGRENLTPYEDIKFLEKKISFQLLRNQLLGKFCAICFENLQKSRLFVSERQVKGLREM